MTHNIAHNQHRNECKSKQYKQEWKCSIVNAEWVKTSEYLYTSEILRQDL